MSKSLLLYVGAFCVMVFALIHFLNQDYDIALLASMQAITFGHLAILVNEPPR